MRCVLDFRRVNPLSLRSADRDHPDLPLGPGVHVLGRDVDGLPTLQPAGSDAWVQVSVDRRGVWMHVRDGVRGLHVNGRPVRRMAMLRAGDALHLDGQELTVVGPVPDARGADGHAAPVHALLRGVGGLHHGRCFALDGVQVIGSAVDAQIRLDDAHPPRVARIAPHADGWALDTFDPLQVPRINGHLRNAGMLHVGDQIAFGAHRFVVEAPRATASQSHTHAAPVEPIAMPMPAPADTAVGTMRRMPWLLLAALAMAGSLALLLMYGAR